MIPSSPLLREILPFSIILLIDSLAETNHCKAPPEYECILFVTQIAMSVSVTFLMSKNNNQNISWYYSGYYYFICIIILKFSNFSVFPHNS